MKHYPGPLSALKPKSKSKGKKKGGKK